MVLTEILKNYENVLKTESALSETIKQKVNDIKVIQNEIEVSRGVILNDSP